MVSFQVEVQASSPVATGASGFLSSFNRAVSPWLMLRHGTPLSNRIGTRTPLLN